ncbi:MarC family protein [Candidatus Micrarchaeota archaeon]|nr:MarC family protein [Candidatus Micrarchaeota archaeon]
MSPLESFGYAFITLFVILDPFASIPPFLTLTAKLSEKHRKSIATKASLIAGVLALLFLLTGISLLELMGISLASFKVAGGIVLGIMGLETVLGISFYKDKKEDMDSIAVLIATPLLTGPGVITSVIVLTGEVGMLFTGAAAFFALFLAWIILFNAHVLRKVAGDRVIGIFSKIMGLVLLALAIQFIKTGILG